jgi:hypothetical protein
MILEIGIPLLVGYSSSVAVDFNALLIFSAITSAFALFIQYEERKVLPVPPWRRKCRKRHPSAFAGHGLSSLLASW